MNLKRPSLIPLDDATLAESIFKSFIEKEMIRAMIVQNMLRQAIKLTNSSKKTKGIYNNIFTDLILCYVPPNPFVIYLGKKSVARFR